jgi:hypothetical protein
MVVQLEQSSQSDAEGGKQKVMMFFEFIWQEAANGAERHSLIRTATSEFVALFGVPTKQRINSSHVRRKEKN